MRLFQIQLLLYFTISTSTFYSCKEVKGNQKEVACGQISVVDSKIKASNLQSKKLDFEEINNNSLDIKTYSTSNDTFQTLSKCNKDFINLLDFKPLTENIDNSYFLNCNLNGTYFYFTILSKSKQNNNTKLHLFIVDRESCEIYDSKTIASKKANNELVSNFEIFFHQDYLNLINIQKTRNNKGALQTIITEHKFSFNEKNMISENLIKNTKFFGKNDALFLEYSNHLNITIPNMNCGECNLSENNPMYRSFIDLQNSDTTSFEIADLWGISGSIGGNKLIFNYNKNNIKINSIQVAAANGLFFNQDGSGGVWQEGGSRLSEWRNLELSENDEALIFSHSNLLNLSKININQINRAENKVQKNESLQYNIDLAYVIFKIDYSIINENFVKYIEFIYGYGD